MEVTAAARALALWVALNLVVLLILSLAVVRERQRRQVMLGDGGDPELAQSIRAFGNAAEYIPPGLIGLGALVLVGAPALAVHTGGIVLTAGRISHAIGLSRAAGPSGFRATGMMLTWVAYILMAAALFIFALG